MYPYVYGALSAVLAIWFQFGLSLTAATLRIGRVLADTNSGTGYQDAITPPFSTKLTIACWFIILCFIYYMYAYGSKNDAIIAAVIFISTTFFSKVIFIPEATSPFWIQMIFRSLLTRAANYEKTGEYMRAEAAKELLEIFYNKLGHRL